VEWNCCGEMSVWGLEVGSVVATGSHPGEKWSSDIEWA
jgi:hypothetical protein